MEHQESHIRADVVLAEMRAGFAGLRNEVVGLRADQKDTNSKASRALELCSGLERGLQSIQVEVANVRKASHEQAQLINTMQAREAVFREQYRRDEERREEQRREDEERREDERRRKAEDRRHDEERRVAIAQQLVRDTDIVKMPATWGGIKAILWAVLATIGGTFAVLTALGWHR